MFSCNTVMPWAPFEIYSLFIFMLFSLTELSFYNIFVSFFFFAISYLFATDSIAFF